jgi:AraC-like DNA-binding protein
VRRDGSLDGVDGAPITISAKILRACVLAAEQRGVSREVLLGPLGADPALLDDADASVPIAWALRVWTAAPALTGDAAFGLHAAELMAATRAHVIDYAAAYCRTPREMFETIVRYQRLLMSRAQVRFTVSDRVASFSRPRETAGFTRPAHLDDFVIAQWVLALRARLSQGFALRVQFVHAAPASADEHARVLQCPVVFDAAFDAIEFDASLLDVPLDRPDATLVAMIHRHADALLAGMPSTTWRPEARDAVDGDDGDARARVTALRRHLIGRAPGGETTIRQVARALATSPRSLQRELHAAGTSFSEVVSDARRERAQAYLREGRYSVSEVAFLLGFAEVSAFSRAFRRWTGESPIEWRRANRAGAMGTNIGAQG